MSISSITSSPSYSNAAVQEEPVPSSSHQQPPQHPQTNAQDPVDTVHISQSAQIQQLAQRGESAAVIASAYGLSVSDVDSDLGISTTSSSAPIAAPSAHGGEHRAAPAPASAAAPTAAASYSKTVTPAPTLSLMA
jgi:hypothetical protein